MTPAGALRTAFAAGAVAVAAAVLAGCAALPFGRNASNGDAVVAPDAAASAASAATARAEYRLEVQAPDPLRALLLNYLDLARFQNAPATDGINAAELERLLRAAPAQARGLLETEGYFNADVTAERAGSADGLPLLRVSVAPGPRATVRSFEIEAVGALQTAAAAGDAAAQRDLAAMRSRWPLQPGSVFRQSAWADAKNTTLARLRADGYAAAGWRSTVAKVDAPTSRVDIATEFDSGPLFRLGEIRIEGVQRYREDAIRQLATFGPGDVYTERGLLDFQDRLQKLGLFEGATVELDADEKTAAAAPVRVRVKELTQQQATVGIGYSANTGPRFSLEHTNRRVFGTPWIAKNKLELGPDQQKWEGELTSYPLEGLYRNLVSGSAAKLRTDDQQLKSWNARAGRTQDSPRIDRLYFAELAHARVDSASLTSQADAVSGNYHWVFRDLDNLLLPTRGQTLSAQAAAGYARGSRSVLGNPLEEARGPFARAFARLTWYAPFGNGWYATARAEAGEVFAHSAVGIPDTLLFRAGGDDSVRGYGYRTLGPEINGVTVGGRTLLTGSIEVARPISASLPAYWWAAFVDAGNAADRWAEIKPAVGYGLGLRWRSPVGPLRVDVAYGQRVKQVRVHFSVGIAF
jgi:translocation and assembly module TamA